MQRVMYLIPLMLSLSIHEFAHAWSAWKLGDDTASMQGRLTLISRLTLNAQLSFDHLGFVATTADEGRTDAVFSVSAGADFEVTRWLIISAGGNFIYRDAEPGGAAALTASEVSALSVPDTQVLLRLTFTY